MKSSLFSSKPNYTTHNYKDARCNIIQNENNYVAARFKLNVIVEKYNAFEKN